MQYGKQLIERVYLHANNWGELSRLQEKQRFTVDLPDWSSVANEANKFMSGFWLYKNKLPSQQSQEDSYRILADRGVVHIVSADSYAKTLMLITKRSLGSTCNFEQNMKWLHKFIETTERDVNELWDFFLNKGVYSPDLMKTFEAITYLYQQLNSASVFLTALQTNNPEAAGAKNEIAELKAKFDSLMKQVSYGNVVDDNRLKVIIDEMTVFASEFPKFCRWHTESWKDEQDQSKKAHLISEFSEVNNKFTRYLKFIKNFDEPGKCSNESDYFDQRQMVAFSELPFEMIRQLSEVSNPSSFRTLQNRASVLNGFRESIQKQIDMVELKNKDETSSVSVPQQFQKDIHRCCGYKVNGHNYVSNENPSDTDAYGCYIAIINIVGEEAAKRITTVLNQTLLADGPTAYFNLGFSPAQRTMSYEFNCDGQEVKLRFNLTLKLGSQQDSEAIPKMGTHVMEVKFSLNELQDDNFYNINHSVLPHLEITEVFDIADLTEKQVEDLEKFN